MRLSDRSETLQASDDDDRITRVGWFLRLTHIDELPQLINVLWNDMSLVGPRPHMLYHDMLFSALLPQYQFRHLVKPGITGLAQSAGYHGATSDFFSISNRTRLDLFYVRRLSLGLDLRILLITLFIVPVKCMKRLYAGGN
jgi:lipopolysaccharide/colanic/teichoic acid biosynthesis glycosyltransferase